MSFDLTLRIWRGDGDGGELKDYVVPAEEGQVVLDVVVQQGAANNRGGFGHWLDILP